MSILMSRRLFPLALVMIMPFVSGEDAVFAQGAVELRGSENIEVVAHVTLGEPINVADIEIEQELSRPYVYIARAAYIPGGEIGFDIISLEDPDNVRVIYRWRIENPALHQGAGPLDPKYFKWQGRYYLSLSTQFRQGGADNNLGAIIFDVTGLPDTSSIHEVARIYAPETPGGFHNTFIYKHSSGRVYLFATVSGPFANIYDLGMVVEGNLEEALIGRVPVPEGAPGRRGYHDFYVAYHPASGQDRFYGGGGGGYYVYDVTNVEQPNLLVTLVGIAGVDGGHTIVADPTGRYVVTEVEYQYAPLRIFDLKPALTGKSMNIDDPISAWTANWRNLSHNQEIRWPYVFVSAYKDGLQVFSIMDPKHPETVAYYDTYMGWPVEPPCSGVCIGAFGVDVRNADGLIVISDDTSGFWAFHMEGFNGWNGKRWGVPDISSVQDFDNGPVNKTTITAQRMPRPQQ